MPTSLSACAGGASVTSPPATGRPPQVHSGRGLFHTTAGGTLRSSGAATRTKHKPSNISLSTSLISGVLGQWVPRHSDTHRLRDLAKPKSRSGSSGLSQSPTAPRTARSCRLSPRVGSDTVLQLPATPRGSEAAPERLRGLMTMPAVLPDDGDVGRRHRLPVPPQHAPPLSSRPTPRMRFVTGAGMAAEKEPVDEPRAAAHDVVTSGSGSTRDEEGLMSSAELPVSPRSEPEPAREEEKLASESSSIRTGDSVRHRVSPAALAEADVAAAVVGSFFQLPPPHPSESSSKPVSPASRGSGCSGCSQAEGAKREPPASAVPSEGSNAQLVGLAFHPAAMLVELRHQQPFSSEEGGSSGAEVSDAVFQRLGSSGHGKQVDNDTCTHLAAELVGTACMHTLLKAPVACDAAASDHPVAESACAAALEELPPSCAAAAAADDAISGGTQPLPSRGLAMREEQQSACFGQAQDYRSLTQLKAALLEIGQLSAVVPGQDTREVLVGEVIRSPNSSSVGCAGKEPVVLGCKATVANSDAGFDAPVMAVSASAAAVAAVSAGEGEEEVAVAATQPLLPSLGASNGNKTELRQVIAALPTPCRRGFFVSPKVEHDTTAVAALPASKSMQRAALCGNDTCRSAAAQMANEAVAEYETDVLPKLVVGGAVRRAAHQSELTETKSRYEAREALLRARLAEAEADNEAMRLQLAACSELVSSCLAVGSDWKAGVDRVF
eukprot:TRINITY_DN12748_c0_g1_i1.p1 TRINITY_DN12748_c0_g1~~TRINITY_DN12748_c0_g1_i1.p1  ORF type:complete len:724 (-),score=161.51 TRINITY_DN12748_c0_g1_i1:269-2440(-)